MRKRSGSGTSLISSRLRIVTPCSAAMCRSSSPRCTVYVRCGAGMGVAVGVTTGGGVSTLDSRSTIARASGTVTGGRFGSGWAPTSGRLTVNARLGTGLNAYSLGMPSRPTTAGKANASARSGHCTPATRCGLAPRGNSACAGWNTEPALRFCYPSAVSALAFLCARRHQRPARQFPTCRRRSVPP